MSLSEPGDHEYDGVFNLIFVGEDQTPTGTWVCNKPSISSKNLLFTKSPPRKWRNSSELSEGFFLDLFNSSRDTIGDYNFENDGLVSFKYYPKSDNENRVEQFKSILGTWSYSERSITIEWEQNDYFEERTEHFDLTKGEEDYEVKLEEKDGRTIEPYFY